MHNISAPKNTGGVSGKNPPVMRDSCSRNPVRFVQPSDTHVFGAPLEPRYIFRAGGLDQ